MTFLSDIRILDASHVMAGPYATYQLALMGAEVIRVERVNGDDFVRTLGGTDEMKAAGLGATYMSQNATKRCIQLDLKHPKGVEIFKKLAATADVVMQNFRPGVMDRLGVGYDDLKALRPDLIYCSLSGFGSDGPIRDAPAYDHIVQGMSGLMSMTGTTMSGPLRVGIPITDYIAGMHASMAILAALNRRAAGGGGGHIEVSMLAAVMSTMGAAGLDTQTTGNVKGLEGNRPFSASPFAGCFPTEDGDLVITANTVAQAKRLVAELEAPDLSSYIDAMESGELLTELERLSAEEALAGALEKDTADNWERRLARVSVPAGKVRSIDEVMAHPQVDAIGCMDEMAFPLGETPLLVPGLGFKDAGDRARVLPAPESLGQSTVEVLREIGVSDDDLDTLARDGAIAGEGLPPAD